jgi:MOSC domain-containing protein YiiM
VDRTRTGKEEIMARYPTPGELALLIEETKESPRDEGIVEYIVLRPGEDERIMAAEAEVSPEGGLHGDRWAKDAAPDTSRQISVINSRFLRAIAGEEARMALSGDNLIVNLDLSEEHMPCGTRVQIGTAAFEVTAHPHSGCRKFQHRFGEHAMEIVNAEAMQSRRLRGLFLRVIRAGMIRRGDPVVKVVG